MPMRSIRAMIAAFALLLAGAAAPAPEPANGIPASAAAKLPSSREEYRALQKQIRNAKPHVESARQKSAALKVQALALRQKLIETVARVQSLERRKTTLDSQIAKLQTEQRAASGRFAKDRVQVAHLLGLLERVQSDYPPAIALEPADALKASRGAMLLGASLPPLYAAAAKLAHQIESLNATRDALAARRREASNNLVQLVETQGELDQLVAKREAEAGAANQSFVGLQAKLDEISRQASDLKTLLDRVAALRRGAGEGGMVVVTAANERQKRHNSLPQFLRPVNGDIVAGPASGRAAMPGLTFAAPKGAAVVAPADSRVLFAGPYHKTGQVLILELGDGYDLVLAGLDRLNVRAGDELLAGEPVGRMALANGTRLYFELRQNGKDLNPAPWLGVDLRKANKS